MRILLIIPPAKIDLKRINPKISVVIGGYHPSLRDLIKFIKGALTLVSF